jgi:hypothetical protein
MLYSYSLIPFFIIVLSGSLFAALKNCRNPKPAFLKAALQCLAAYTVVCLLLGLRSPSSIHAYLFLFCILTLAYSETKLIAALETSFILILIVNAIVCLIEMELGYLQIFEPSIRPIYLEVSGFLVSSRGFLAEQIGLVREFNSFELIRPNGLFGNLYLSSFLLVVYYAYLDAENKNRYLRYSVAIILVMTGCFQSMLALLVYACFAVRGKLVSLGIAVVSLIPLFFLLRQHYSFANYSSSNNMIRLSVESVTTFARVPLKELFIGMDFYDLIGLLKDRGVTDGVLEAGFFRYTIIYGLINSVIVISILIYLFKKFKSRKARSMLVATISTVVHYFMLPSLAGMTMVFFFVFKYGPRVDDQLCDY